MHVSDSIVRWCGGLCLPLHGLQCAFYLHVVSLGRKLHTHLVRVCTFLQNEGLYNMIVLVAYMYQQTDSRKKRKEITREGIYVHVG